MLAPMAAPPFDRLAESFWPAGPDDHTFAVLDGARDPRVHGAVTGSGLPHRCLYIGAVAPVLARAAPWLVQLDGPPAAVRALVGAAWGRAWGVFARSDASLDGLHRHLRRLLRVQDERGKTLLFRYYDPRVLRVYLPTCTEDELDQVFGPVERFVLEGDAPQRVVTFTRDGGALRRAEVVHEERPNWIKDYLRSTR